MENRKAIPTPKTTKTQNHREVLEVDFHLQRMMESYSPTRPLQVDLVLNMAVHSTELGTIWEVDKDHSYHRYPPAGQGGQRLKQWFSVWDNYIIVYLSMSIYVYLTVSTSVYRSFSTTASLAGKHIAKTMSG